MNDFPESDFDPKEGDFFTIDRSWNNELWICIGTNESHIRGMIVGDGYWSGRKKIFPKKDYHFYKSDELI